jgi:hypothetical protein
MSGTQPFHLERHEVDFCVIGGGMAGLCAALAAARNGAKVVLMQDRPVLGGNASSEVRMHICGADCHGGLPHLRETGILEEVRLQGLLENPQRSHSMQDLHLHVLLAQHPNVTLLLNCSCLDAEMDGNRIASVTGWQTTTQTRHTVLAKIFADCSGDSVLVPLTGAPHMSGREGKGRFNESLAPDGPDHQAMGMTCMFMTRKHDRPMPFVRPSWANEYRSCDDLPYGAKGHDWFQSGYWWIELGGDDPEQIRNTERTRDELLKVVLGVWDHLKNRCPHVDASHHALDWIEFLPGKRSSRRYVGAHILTQNDIEREGRFDDLVAYGGWSMDVHDVKGFKAVKEKREATTFNHTPSPYGIPYRSFYSEAVPNLMFAGRNHSASFLAHSSTRVMGTCAAMGQAVGTAAALAVKKGILPAGVLPQVKELQQLLLRDDCYLPWVPFAHSGITKEAKLSASQGNPEPLRDGFTRQVGNDPHCWVARPGDWATYQWDGARRLADAALVLDSALEREITLSNLHHRPDQLTPPEVMPRKWELEVLSDGQWAKVHAEERNWRRHHRISIGRPVRGVRFRLFETWGAAESRVYGFHLA